MKTTCQVVTITPKMASDWMSHNQDNRSLSKSRVKRIAHDIRSGKFILTPDAIAFDETGRLSNGQHRLMACIQAAIPIKCLVMRDADKNAFMVTDIGMKKNAKIALTTMGKKSTTYLAALAKKVFQIKEKPYDLSTALCHAEAVMPMDIAEIVTSHKELDRIVEDAIGLFGPDKLMTSHTAIATALWLAHRANFYDEFLEFIVSASVGSSLEVNESRYLLRRRLASGFHVTNKGRMDNFVTREHIALMIKAFAMHKYGVKANVLIWRTSEAFPDFTGESLKARRVKAS